MTRKIIGIIVCCIIVVMQTSAQGLSVEVNGGLQGTRYSLHNGATQLLPGGSLGLLYTFQLRDRWSLLAGITGGIYRTQATLSDGAVFSNYQVDDVGSAFQYNMKVEGYKETQRFFAAGIPVMLQYYTPGAGRQWYFNAGGKLLFPTSAQTNISARQLNLSGYYPDYNVVVSDLPQHGLGTLNGLKASATNKLKPAAALSAGAGLILTLPRGMHIYAGLYVDYGITDLKGKSDSLPLVSYSPSGLNGVKANGVLNMANAGPMKLLSVGLQVRLSLGNARPKSAVKPAVKEVPPNPVDTTVSDEEAAAIMKPIIFGVMDEISIPEREYPQLDEVASILTRHPAMRISIVGHICNSGGEIEDPKVGLDRAKAVARYLIGRGIRRNRINVDGEKVSDPVLPNNPAANYAKRRVVMRIE
ncbi:MAG TPA: OmpA family protein [Puia sp.]|jgi:outer membrane protein OmpA-like peptidoglycan-associated protein|nr:OmpA family protein [Puia sp.]